MLFAKKYYRLKYYKTKFKAFHCRKPKKCWISIEKLYGKNWRYFEIDFDEILFFTFFSLSGFGSEKWSGVWTLPSSRIGRLISQVAGDKSTSWGYFYTMRENLGERDSIRVSLYETWNERVRKRVRLCLSHTTRD